VGIAVTGKLPDPGAVALGQRGLRGTGLRNESRLQGNGGACSGGRGFEEGATRDAASEW
jgi:hypothetical protein